MSFDRPLVYAHIGDLHITDAEQQNYRDFLAIAAQIETQCAAALDFVFLPGDNADNGRPEQYDLVRSGLNGLGTPVFAISGDHDMEPGDLTNFREGLGVGNLPHALQIRGHRCLFLDCCGAGAGGPDFRLGTPQIAWLERQLQAATSSGETIVVFMHTYPADLCGDGEATAITDLLSRHRVALVDMGHTHYNELAHDGATVFAATRSTGQIEEGPVGFSLVTIDRGVVSWRFKRLDEQYPFVMITKPADVRLARDDHPRNDTGAIQAVVFGKDAIDRADYRVDDGDWIAMAREGRQPLWTATGAPIATGDHKIAVRAVAESGRLGVHTIQTGVRTTGAPSRESFGSDALSIGAWPENEIFGTQLGPNRNGRKW